METVHVPLEYLGLKICSKDLCIKQKREDLKETSGRKKVKLK